MTPRSLYIHVPFCTRRCSYCDFAVEATRQPPVDEWLEAIARELALTAVEQGWAEPLRLDTVYVGGGTPSLLGEGVMGRLREGLAPSAVWSDAAEWTCEANPESFTPALARDWREAGVNRISLGVQTFHPASLRWMGRLHGPEGPARAVESARAVGFENVSVDLIFGLPSRLGRDWGEDLDRSVALEPEHVSLYGLTAEPGAPLGRWVREERERLAGEDRYADEYLLADERLTAAGLEHYEVSNFGRPGLHSRHNLTYWTGDPYAALGPGAHAYLPPHRRWNTRSWSEYADSLARGRLPIDGSEEIDRETEDLERAWLHLRTNLPFRPDPESEREARLARFWVENGFAESVGDAVRLTPRGWLLLDELAVALHRARYEAPARANQSLTIPMRSSRFSADLNPIGG